MAEHANTFLLLTILVLVTILLVFGMKYFSAARIVHARATARKPIASWRKKRSRCKQPIPRRRLRFRPIFPR
jgi:hypothetical protein